MNPTANTITRRSFIKKTALTSGAVAVLSQGVSLAAEEDISSAWGKCKKKCNNNPSPVFGGIGGTQQGGRIEEPVGSGTFKYFTLLECKCTAGHTMGTFRGPFLATSPAGVTTSLYTSANLPAEHTTDHGPCGK